MAMPTSLGQAEARSLKLDLGFPRRRRQGPKYSGHLIVLPQAYSQETDMEVGLLGLELPAIRDASIVGRGLTQRTIMSAQLGVLRAILFL